MDQASRSIFLLSLNLNFENVKVPSTIVLIRNNDVEYLRKGAVVVSGEILDEKSFYIHFVMSFYDSRRENASADLLIVNKNLISISKTLKFSFYLFNRSNLCNHLCNHLQLSKDVELQRKSLFSSSLVGQIVTSIVKKMILSITWSLHGPHEPLVPPFWNIHLGLQTHVEYPKGQFKVYPCKTDTKNMFSILLLRCGDVASNPGPNPRLQHNDGENTSSRSRTINDALQEIHKTGKSGLQVVTLNVRGLGDRKKVRHLVNSCYKISKAAKNSLFLLQETYVVNLDLLRYLWRGEFHITSGNGNSLGCITLVTAPYKIVKVFELGQRGHVLALSKDDLNKVELVVANVYAPNGFDREKRLFFDEALEALLEIKTTYDCDNVILGGDLNVVLNEDEVKNRAYTSVERRLADELKVLFNQSNLTDSWQKVKLSQPCYTWTSNRSGQPSFSTLDRVLFTENKLSFLNVVADWSLSISDHAAVIAKFDEIATRHHSVLIPRLDPRLLLDQEGKATMDEIFREMYDQRSADWNPHVSLEYLKLCIRTASNAAVGKIKARYRDEELSLNQSINSVINSLTESNVAQAERDLLMHKLDDLRQLKRGLVERIGTKLERRTARKWYNEGELSNKYFFNLMNRKTNDEIKVVLSDNGTELKEPEEIEAAIRDFYKRLYEDTSLGLDDNDVIFRNIEPVSPEAASVMEERLTIDDLEKTLATCSDSAPGPDGIPYSFLKHFWNDVGPCLIRSWNHSLDTNQLPPSHKISYLRLIPKAGKDTRVIGNLRPITLSNTDHKLISKAYAKKLTKVVEDKIGAEQTAYIPGRLINDNVRAMLTTIDLANVDQLVDGVVVSLDAKKAFDSVDHQFIRRCLKAFGLECFVHVFDTLYRDLSSEIIINGKTISGYKILKGVKQGDALSCILFILCIEPLIRNIKHNPNIEPIESALLPIRMPKAYGYADDVTVVAKRTVEGIQSIFTEYEEFSKSSGLILNADKTDLLTFNNARRNNFSCDISYLGVTHRLVAANEIKINGILLLQDPLEREARNVAKVVHAMEGQLLTWSSRNLTLIGKILIIKTFAISQVIYLLQSMSLSEASYGMINKVVYKYLWNKNFRAVKAPDRIKREVMMTPLRLGGFGMLDIKELAESLDLRSYGRLITTNHPFFKQLKARIKNEDFFNVVINDAVDPKLTRALVLISSNRKKIFEWTVPEIVSNNVLSSTLLNMPIAKLLSGPGRQSLHFFAVHRRVPNPKIRDVNVQELRVLERYLVKPELVQIVRALVNLGPRPVPIHDDKDLYVTNSRDIRCLSAMSSKSIRLNQSNVEDKIICLYKIGLALNPGEVLSWTSKVRKLTSTRHKNILLRVAHGDIFSNSRLHKFRLRDNPGCANCDEAVESIKHRITECPKAQETWLKVNESKIALGLTPLSDFTIENLLGTKDRVSSIELALNAEIIHRLTSKGEGYCPNQVVKASLQLLSYAEKLDSALKEKFKVHVIAMGVNT